MVPLDRVVRQMVSPMLKLWKWSNCFSIWCSPSVEENTTNLMNISRLGREKKPQFTLAPTGMAPSHPEAAE